MPSVLTRAVAFAAMGALAACGGGDASGPSPSLTPSVLALGDRHACQARPAGTVCWGTGTSGQLGIGATPADTTPVAVAGDPGFVSLAAGQAHTCGLDAEGGAWCWGSDRDGQLGLGAPADELCGVFPCATRPRRVAGGHVFRLLTAGQRFTCGLTTDRLVYCWGLNDTGQLGTAADTDHCEDGRCTRTPLAEASGRAFATVSAGLSHACALDAGGTAYCWGWYGLVVAGEHTNATFDPEATAAPGVSFTQLSAGGLHTCGLTDAGRAWCWGLDAVGAGPTVLEADHPVEVLGGPSFRAIASARYTSCGLDADGMRWCWGPNGSGEVGREPVGTSVRFDQPAAATGGMRFTTIEPGASSYCGQLEDGRTACWGSGEFGELGSGTSNSVTPVLVSLPGM